MKTRYLIGIDPGVKTGLAIWDREEKTFTRLDTLSIVEGMRIVLTGYQVEIAKIEVRFEDARLRKWFGNAGREQLQGAGSIKRDCSIWQEFCEYHGIHFRAIAPKNNTTKTTAERFKRLTGWEGRTSEHSRDAAMLVFGG